MPETKWPETREQLIALMKELKINSPLEFDSFTSAVINERSFDKINNYIQGKKSSNVKLIHSGECNKDIGSRSEADIWVAQFYGPRQSP